MKKPLLISGLISLIILACLMPGCSSGEDNAAPPAGSSIITDGKAQALVFTTPT